MKKKKRKFKKVFLVLTLAAAVMAAVLAIRHSSAFATLNFEGFGWIGNQLVNGADNGNSSIGMLSALSGQSGCSGSAYAVTLGGKEGDATRDVLGNAWFGIGSQPDTYIGKGFEGATCDADGSSLGWVNFQSGSPSFCRDDCHSAQWHDADSDPKNGFGGNIDGWAKVVSMSPPFNSQDNGWVHLANCNYPNKYCVQMDSTGAISGYAWNSGGANDSIGNNAGLGWIKFNKMQICSIGFASDTMTISDSAASLAVTRKIPSALAVPVTLTVTNNPSRLKFSSSGNTCYTDGSKYCGTFPANQTTFPVPIVISPFSGDICNDSATVSVSSACGQSETTITINKICSVSCTPKSATIMPGESQEFTANSPEYPNSSFSWNVASDPGGCVEGLTASDGTANCNNTKSCTVKARIYSQSTGELCAMQSVGLSVSNCCSSDTCGFNLSRPGWIETNP